GDKAVTYESAHPPHYIAHRKGWLSLHTGGSPHTAAGPGRVGLGTRGARGHTGMGGRDAVLKRRANLLVVCAVVVRGLAPAKLHFLVGYAETLLAHFYKCPVRLELQTVPARVPYKYL
ncbi:RT24 protein, partial [Steatornis caripensis]|nr:RT24 protein [Steatornis caripensis]